MSLAQSELSRAAAHAMRPPITYGFNRLTAQYVAGSICLMFADSFELDFKCPLNRKNMGNDVASGFTRKPKIDGTGTNLYTVKFDMVNRLWEHRTDNPKLAIKPIRVEPEQLHNHERHRPG